MPERSRDWIEQAEHDLEKAKLDLQWRYYEWACFTAHQGAEMAIKAVYYARHGEARGHGLRELLSGVGLPVGDALLRRQHSWIGSTFQPAIRTDYLRAYLTIISPRMMR